MRLDDLVGLTDDVERRQLDDVAASAMSAPEKVGRGLWVEDEAAAEDREARACRQQQRSSQRVTRRLLTRRLLTRREVCGVLIYRYRCDERRHRGAL